MYLCVISISYTNFNVFFGRFIIIYSVLHRLYWSLHRFIILFPTNKHLHNRRHDNISIYKSRCYKLNKPKSII